MTDVSWGAKRTCQSCACKYYDLNRTPVLCPKCQTEYDPASAKKLRSDSFYKPSGRAKSVFGAAATPVAAKEEEPEGELDEADEEDETEDDTDEGATLDDVSELEEDGDLVKVTPGDDR